MNKNRLWLEDEHLITMKSHDNPVQIIVHSQHPPEYNIVSLVPNYLWLPMASHLTALNNGQTIPVIPNFTGTWQSKPNEVARAVEYALKAGYRHIDCAWWETLVDREMILTNVYTTGHMGTKRRSARACVHQAFRGRKCLSPASFGVRTIDVLRTASTRHSQTWEQHIWIFTWCTGLLP